MRYPVLILLIIIGVIGGGELFDAPSVFGTNTAQITATVKVSVCGNGVKEGGEQCDNTDLGGSDCISLGYNGGTLGCNTDCTFDTSSCLSGGGGGGGTYVPPATTAQVIFKGLAFPGRTVTLLKDAQVVTATIASSDGSFQIDLSNLSTGTYIFSLYSEDYKGNRSSLLTFPLTVSSGTTTRLDNIFIAPTITTDKVEVKKGDDITIFGQSAPYADVIISVSSGENFFVKTSSDKSGVYVYHYNTSFLDYGCHYAKSKASLEGRIVSSYSKSVSFKVGMSNRSREVVSTSVKADFNSDNRVNLIDFSIAAYWYKRPSPPSQIDLNGDHKVDLVDFSIIAYYWTG